MATTPELYWKDKLPEKLPNGVEFQFITKEQAKAKGKLQQVLNMGEANAYVRTSPQGFQPYVQWKRDNRR